MLKYLIKDKNCFFTLYQETYLYLAFNNLKIRSKKRQQW